MKSNTPKYLDCSLKIYASFHQRQKGILLAEASFKYRNVQMLEGTLGDHKITNIFQTYSQNTTLLALRSTLSTTCFGPYIGHHQAVLNLSSSCTIYVVYSGRRDLVYKS